MMYMKKAENEKSTVLQRSREKMPEAESVFTYEDRKVHSGAGYVILILKIIESSMARTRR